MKKYIENKARNVKANKRLVYYLLTATRICVVLLTGFYSTKEVFRITLLEQMIKKENEHGRL